MRVKKTPNELKFVKLFFESNNDSEEITFPLICKFIREKFQVTQFEMAKKLNIPVITYKSWEQGKQNPNAKAAVNLFIMYLQAMQVKEVEDQLNESETISFLDQLIRFNKIKPQTIATQSSIDGATS